MAFYKQSPKTLTSPDANNRRWPIIIYVYVFIYLPYKQGGPPEFLPLAVEIIGIRLFHKKKMLVLWGKMRHGMNSAIRTGRAARLAGCRTNLKDKLSSNRRRYTYALIELGWLTLLFIFGFIFLCFRSASAIIKILIENINKLRLNWIIDMYVVGLWEVKAVCDEIDNNF